MFNEMYNLSLDVLNEVGVVGDMRLGKRKYSDI